jgi:hypothetical protein
LQQAQLLQAQLASHLQLVAQVPQALGLQHSHLLSSHLQSGPQLQFWQLTHSFPEQQFLVDSIGDL